MLAGVHAPSTAVAAEPAGAVRMAGAGGERLIGVGRRRWQRLECPARYPRVPGGEHGNERLDRTQTNSGGGRRRGDGVKRRRRKGSSAEEREDLARGRRERARRARTELAAKAQGEEPGDAGASAEDGDPAAKGKAKARKPGAADRKREERRAARERLLGGKRAQATRAEGAEKPSKPAGDAADRPPAAAEGGKRSRQPGKDAEGRQPGRSTDAKGSREPDESEDARRPERAAKKGTPAKRSRRRLRGDREEPARAGRKRAAKKGRRRRGGGRRSGAAAKRAGRGALVALKRGGAETGRRARGGAAKAGGVAGGLLVLAFTALFTALGFVFKVIVVAYRRIAPPLRKGLRLARRVIDAASLQVTPVRVLALVVAGAAILLALSQFAVYRSISIGNDAYADGIQTVAPAPVRETADTGSAHSYLMVPLAAAALVLLGAALTGRWRLCRLIALAGLAAIAVGLLNDRPAGLDPGADAVVYTGVEATLLGGFYAQLFSGLLLMLSSMLLGRELRAAGARSPARAPRAGRRSLRRQSGAEGARA